MFKNYLKIAWRNLWKDKTFSLINITGLSVAFGVAILLFMAAFFELSYDDFHKNKQSLYKVYTVQRTPKGQEAGTSQPAPFAGALKTEVPGVERITRLLQDGALSIYGEKEMVMDAIWVDADFFSMFTFPILEGNDGESLKDLKSVVLTKTGADKLFGNTHVVGETLNIMINGQERPFTVAAVVEDHPQNSSIEFEMAVRFENNGEYVKTKEEWGAQYHEVYVQLQKGVSSLQFEQNTHAFTELHYKESIEAAKRDGALANADGVFRELKLLPLSNVRFTSFRKGYADHNRSIPFLILGIAVLILFIACVNYVNMSIAKSVQRLKEIGMRKTLGAKRKQLFFQFWGESLVVFLMALFFGGLLCALFFGDFKTLFRTGLTLDILGSPMFIAGFLGIVLLITLIVGGYPAALLSRLGTIQSLKGKMETNGKNRVRDVLMVVQFGIAILLITGTLILREQVEFMRNKNLGFEKAQVMSFPLNGKRNGYDALRLLKQELDGNPNILSVSGANNNLGRGKDGSMSSSVIGFEHKGRSVRTHFLAVDHEYVQTLGLEMAMGHNFRSNSDSLGVVINEAMARELGEEDPLSVTVGFDEGVETPIFGVVKDYHFQGLDRAIEPITFFMGKDLELTYAYVKVGPSGMADSFAAVEDAWRKVEPNAEFLGSFLDENIDRTFQKEKIMAMMIASGSVIAIVLSCIGLFAMSMLIVSQRTKEIGVRKVLGANIVSLAYMLTKDFLKLVLLAFLIASPISWWLMREWLANYAYRIDLSIWFFVVSGSLAVLIALLTVGARTIKAAMASPVKSLRSE